MHRALVGRLKMAEPIFTVSYNGLWRAEDNFTLLYFIRPVGTLGVDIRK